MTRRPGLSAAVLAILAVTSVPAEAFGYVRSAVGDTSFAWPSSCVWMTAYPQDIHNMTAAETLSAISAAAGAWDKESPSLAACTYLDFKVTAAPQGELPLSAALDGRNAIVFRGDSWCTPTPPYGDDVCHDSTLLALTTVFARLTTGEILDTDIEINAVNFTWNDLQNNVRAGDEQDLQSLLTRELGLTLGFTDPCWLPPHDGSTRPVDDRGASVPDCDQASADIRASVMFPDVAYPDASGRALTAEDRRGLCEVYPLASDPGVCLDPALARDGGVDAAADGGSDGGDAGDPMPGSGGGCGCDVTDTVARSWLWMALGLSLLGVSRLRRRRRA